jgi:uncharacterized PurR-regulated membrane protein YhhQ (DUF165 family)
MIIPDGVMLVGRLFLLIGSQHELGGNVPGQSAVAAVLCPLVAIVVVVLVLSFDTQRGEIEKKSAID